MEEKREYYVKSMFLNAYLMSKGIKYNRIDKLEDNKLVFYYDANDELFAAINRYKEDKAMKDFVHNYNIVRDLLYKSKRN